MHHATITAEVRELEPTSDGWAQHEATGRACVVCPCGLNTGFIANSAVVDAYREHVRPGQKISITLTGGHQDLRDMIRQIVQNN